MRSTCKTFLFLLVFVICISLYFAGVNSTLRKKYEVTIVERDSLQEQVDYLRGEVTSLNFQLGNQLIYEDDVDSVRIYRQLPNGIFIDSAYLELENQSTKIKSKK